MATVKKSKKKVVIPICIILVIAIVFGSVFIAKAKTGGEEVSLYTISTGDIYEKVSLTGEVTSGAKKEYKVGTVATVKEVFVKVGDDVKKGDVLASFDTASLDEQVSSVQASYNSASKEYNNAVAEQKSAKKTADALKKQVDILDKKVKKLEKKVNTSTSTTAKKTTAKKTTTTTAPSTTKNKGSEVLSSILAQTTTTTTTTAPTSAATTSTTRAPEAGTNRFAINTSAYPNNTYGIVTGGGVYSQDKTVTIKAIPNEGYQFFGWYTSNTAILTGDDPVSVNPSLEIKYNNRPVETYYAYFVEANDSNVSTTKPASLNDLITSMQTISDNLITITNDVKTMLDLNKIIANTISNAISSGQLNSDAIADAVGKDVSKAIRDGIIDSAKLLVEEDIAVQMVEAAVAQIDFKAIAKQVADSDNVSLTASEVQLATLRAQYELYNAKADGTVVNAQKSALDATKKSLDILKEQQTELKNGWKADFDGVITAVDVNDGAQTSLISTGITLENLNTLVATVSLSEYDVHKVKVGMDCVITTAYGTYDGKVATIAPTATGGSSSSMLDSVGSMAGISGLSSLTDSGAGVECTITIDKPDENIIAGFDANVEIKTGEYLGVTVVPIESITLEKTGTYVYLYNEEEGTVTKTKIETGASSDSEYQVISGIKTGDKIVSTPSTDYKEDTFKVKVVQK